MNAQQHGSKQAARNRRFRIVAAVSLAGALIAGILALTIPAVAQTGRETAVPQTGSDAPVGAGETESAPAERRTERLNAALEPLVTAGTITSGQRDAVVETLLSARTEATFANGHGGHNGPRSGRFFVPAHAGDDLLELLDTTRTDLGDRLRAGETLADVAGSVGVEVAAVVDLLVSSARDHLEAAVEAGRVDDENTEACVAAIEARVTARVNGEQPGEDTDLGSCGLGNYKWRHARGGFDLGNHAGDGNHWGRGIHRRHTS